MRIHLKVMPGSSRELVEKIDDGKYKIYTHKPAVEGKANKASIEMLAEYFNIKKSRISIVKGAKSRDKILKIQ
ncbi:MAG: DUF167 domain-containing protein [Candidatus Omnitrophica bacterium]|nr:DUF167 domain-containing protein [Candidatus Omnitrophota bacterium]